MDSASTGTGADAIGEPFDQSNDQAQSLAGDSDGTAESDTGSAADRDGDDRPVGDGNSPEILGRLKGDD